MKGKKKDALNDLLALEAGAKIRIRGSQKNMQEL